MLIFKQKNYTFLKSIYLKIISKCIISYILIDIIPSKKPNIFPSALILPWYSLFDSGISSPDTIYNIAPAAKLKHILITSFDIPPTNEPKNAPIPVVIPYNIT